MLAAFIRFASAKTCRRAGKAADGWATLAALSAVSSQRNQFVEGRASSPAGRCEAPQRFPFLPVYSEGVNPCLLHPPISAKSLSLKDLYGKYSGIRSYGPKNRSRSASHPSSTLHSLPCLPDSLRSHLKTDTNAKGATGGHALDLSSNCPQLLVSGLEASNLSFTPFYFYTFRRNAQ
jgi:hypothetical protein